LRRCLVADGFSVDSSDFSKLAADLSGVPDGTGKFVRKAAEVTARKVKDAWRDKLKGASYIPHGSGTIGYDIKDGRGEVEAEIGPEMQRSQAQIVGIIEYGKGPHVPARGYGLASLLENLNDFEHGLHEAIDDALKEQGL
jgi:hypothetical protein